MNQATLIARTQFFLRFFLAATVAIVALASSTAQATTLLPPGTTINPPQAVTPPFLPTIVDSKTSTFSAGSFSGTLDVQVLKVSASNPFFPTDPDALIFAYTISNDVSSTDAIERLTINGFGNVLNVDAGYDGGSPLVAPSFINRTTPGGGNLIGFTFLDPAPLSFGKTSSTLYVYTDSHEYHTSTAAVSDGTTVDGIATLAPNAFNSVPEPSSLVLGALAMLGFVGMFRSRTVRAKT